MTCTALTSLALLFHVLIRHFHLPPIALATTPRRALLQEMYAIIEIRTLGYFDVKECYIAVSLVSFGCWKRTIIRFRLVEPW
jgi:hypothetical protein